MEYRIFGWEASLTPRTSSNICYIVAMTNFFLQAPPTQSFEGQLLEASAVKPVVAASVPRGYPIEGVFARMAIQGQGLTCVVFSEPTLVQRYYKLFAQAGYGYPELALYDGNQTPHELRYLQENARRGRVQLLFTTAERMGSLHMIQLLVHSPVQRLVITEAQNLLPEFANAKTYQRVWDGLDELRKKPNMVFLTPLFSVDRLQALESRLKLGPIAWLRKDPIFEHSRLEVHKLLPKGDRLARLVRLLKGRGNGKGTEYSLVRRLNGLPRTLIYTRSNNQARMLASQLVQHGFNAVSYTYRLPENDKLRIEKRLLNEQNLIVTVPYSLAEQLRLLPEEPRVLVFWNTPPSLDEAASLLFPHTLAMDLESNETMVEGWILHQRSDWAFAMDDRTHPTLWQRQKKAYKAWRDWILEQDCRRRTLLNKVLADQEDIYGTLMESDCGVCDYCLFQAHQVGPGFWRTLLNHLLY